VGLGFLFNNSWTYQQYGCQTHVSWQKLVFKLNGILVVILLTAIGGYFINGYWWILVFINGYYMSGYWWLLY
jgi:hypothetical protein